MTDASVAPQDVVEDDDWSMTRVLDCAMDVAERDDVSIGDLITAFGPASFLPLLLLPAITLVSPLSGIPLFSSFNALIIILVAAQMLTGRGCLWLPDWIKKRGIAGHRLRAGLERVHPVGRWFDRHAHRRVGILFRRPIWFALPLSCISMAALIPFFELVPFSASLLGAAIALITLGMLTRDGVWVLAGAVPFLGAILVVAKVFT